MNNYNHLGMDTWTSSGLNRYQCYRHKKKHNEHGVHVSHEKLQKNSVCNCENFSLTHKNQVNLANLENKYVNIIQERLN